MQISNDPTHLMGTTLIAIAAKQVEEFHSLKQTQTVVNPRFYSLLFQFFMKIMITFNAVRVCVKTEGGRGEMCVPDDFI